MFNMFSEVKIFSRIYNLLEKSVLFNRIRNSLSKQFCQQIKWKYQDSQKSFSNYISSRRSMKFFKFFKLIIINYSIINHFILYHRYYILFIMWLKYILNLNLNRIIYYIAFSTVSIFYLLLLLYPINFTSILSIYWFI